MSRSWSESEIEILKANYPDKLTIDLLDLLPGRSVSAITGKAYNLCLYKSDAFHASGMGGRLVAGDVRGVNSRFKLNHTGWNKGLKQSSYMSAEAIERTKKTRFKKGTDPHNTVPIGTERLSKEGYIEVKVFHYKDGSANNRNFMFKHRLIYETYFGEIPKDKIVFFLDGNNRNFSPENLGLRSRAEHMIANTFLDRAVVKRFMGVKDPELIKNIVENRPDLVAFQKKIIKLKNKINGRNREVNPTTRE